MIVETTFPRSQWSSPSRSTYSGTWWIKRKLRFRGGLLSFLPFPLYTKRTKNYWVKKSLNRDHRATQIFSRALLNTGQSFQRSWVTGRKSRMASLALPNSVKRKSILMRSFCVRSEVSEERCSKNILTIGKKNLSSSKESIGESLWVIVPILCGMPCVSQRARWFPTDRHVQ